MIKLIDQLSEITGKIAGWVFFAIGLCIFYEITMRYVFNMPTIWVDEISRLLQVWAAFMAAAFALKHRDLIVIDVLWRAPDSPFRKISETITLLIILVFAIVVIRHSADLWYGSFIKGHKTDSLLGLPKWLNQGAIWTSFLLLTLQAGAEIIKVWRDGIPVTDPHEGNHDI